MAALLRIADENEDTRKNMQAKEKPDEPSGKQKKKWAAQKKRWAKYSGQLDTIGFITHRLPQGLKSAARNLLLYLRDERGVWWNDISSEVVIYEQNKKSKQSRAGNTSSQTVDETSRDSDDTDTDTAEDIYDSISRKHVVRGSNITDIIHHALSEGPFEPIGYRTVYKYMPDYVTKPVSAKKLEQQRKRKAKKVKIKKEKMQATHAKTSRIANRDYLDDSYSENDEDSQASYASTSEWQEESEEEQEDTAQSKGAEYAAARDMTLPKKRKREEELMDSSEDENDERETMEKRKKKRKNQDKKPRRSAVKTKPSQAKPSSKKIQQLRQKYTTKAGRTTWQWKTLDSVGIKK